MDEAQIGQLGSKMREAYSTIASEPAIMAEPGKKRVSRRLRKSPTFAGNASGNSAMSGNLVRQYPLASLLAAAGIGFVLARL